MNAYLVVGIQTLKVQVPPKKDIITVICVALVTSKPWYTFHFAVNTKMYNIK